MGTHQQWAAPGSIATDKQSPSTQSQPLVTISHQGGEEWTMKQESLVKTTETKFTMGQQFEEMTADGRKVLTTNTVVGPNTLFQEMLGTGGGKDSVCTREFMAEKMK